MAKRDRNDCPTRGEDPGGANDRVDRPVAAFDENVGCNGANELNRGVAGKPGHQVDRFQSPDERKAIGQCVDRTVVALAKAAHGRIVIEGNDQACAECAGLRQVSDMATVQDVKDAVGEHHGPGQSPKRVDQTLGRRDLALMDRGRRCRGDTPRCQRAGDPLRGDCHAQRGFVTGRVIPP